MRTFNQMMITTALAAVTVACSAQVPRHQPRQRAVFGRAMAAHQVNTSQLPAGTRVLADVRYGPGDLQTFDVYAPANAHNAPVIFMVHGGGWRRGDKSAKGVVQNKVMHWGPKGFIVISVNYPLVPDVTPVEEAQNVGLAMAVAQGDAPAWGGDPNAFVLMGHSAGANIVSQIAARPQIATSRGALPWLGTVALDSAAYNVVTIMDAPHLSLYDIAFGDDRDLQAAASPILQIDGKIAPFLAVCSSRRVDSCAQATLFARKAEGFGSTVQVLPVDLSHGEINAELGEPSDYTLAVDRFLSRLGSSLLARIYKLRQ